MPSGSTAENRGRDSPTTECWSGQAAEHFQQRAEFLPLCNRGFGPLAVTV
jgi:hypothetical protein